MRRFLALAAVAVGLFPVQTPADTMPAVPQVTADHAKFDELKGPFETGQDVTKACLSCHTEAGKQMIQSIHWTWETVNPKTGQTLGKQNVLNAFCGNLESNEPRCTSCHAGYGWEETAEFDFADETAIDCLVCHDTTKTYVKWPTHAGHPLYEPLTQKKRMVPYADELVKVLEDGKFTHMPPDLAKVAQSVGRPDRESCGNCHFYGGGGDNVKHGDLSSALVNPTPHVDVHMSPDGANLVCVDCHVGNAHAWAGSRYHGTIEDETEKKPGFRNTDVLACNSCHTDKPHNALTVTGLKLNDHTDRVACQTCHIPEYAKGGVSTKTWWDWSTAGKLKDGKPYAEYDDLHRHTYLSTKGDFAWGDDVVPDYAFWNGIVEYTMLGEEIDPTQIVGVNKIGGSPEDPDAKIFPFKKMRGKQAYDTVHNHLLMSNVFGPETDTAFWTNFDWSKALAAGMKDSDVPFSGEFDFAETEMWWPTTHMVAPADEALDCDSCHAKDGRLDNVGGFYMPGRDGFGMVDWVALGALLLTIMGIGLHAGIRIVMGLTRKKEG